MRNNGGGSITMADTIAQLFVNNYKNGQARALVAPLNARLFANDSQEPNWRAAYTQVGTGDQFTPLVYFNTNEECNAVGQGNF